MLIAGSLIKIRVYGLIRINMKLLPHAHSIFSRKFKKRIAYSFVSHIGFIIIEISFLTDTRLNGSLLKIISHGVIGAVLFFLAGTTYDRIHIVYLDEMAAIAIQMPTQFTMFSIFSMASLALPGMKGFVAKLIVFFEIITGQNYLLVPTLLITFVMAIKIILNPISLLSTLNILWT
uniref:NADH:quinone oxidoreductase/Mrp antiporter transmembrane domain-containing protein n=1 Tax=Solanum lycopersicum TaxID=4081 RepID=A0A3Q7EEU1_SOLLC